MCGTGFAYDSLVIFFVLLLMAFSFGAEAREPSVQEVQAESIRYLGVHATEMDRWERKSRLSAALPRLQVGFQRDLKDVISLSTKDTVSVNGGDVFVGPNQNNFDKNFNQGTSFEVKALWSLNDLLFNRDMLLASHERRSWIHERNQMLQEITSAYFTRRRLKDELRKRRDSPALREKKKILLDQALGTVDGYTGGWFSEELQK